MSERVHEDRASGSIAYLQQTDAKDFSRLLRVNRRTKDKETAEKNEGNHASTGLHDYLSDHSIRSRQHIWRNREADLLGRFEIDHQLKLCRLFDRKVGGL